MLCVLAALVCTSEHSSTSRQSIAELWLLQVCIPNSKPRVFSSNDLTSIGTGAWSGCATGAAAGPPETVMVRQYGFPSCQGSAPSSAPASTGFVPPSAHRQVGLLKAVAAKPPLGGTPSSGECLLSWPGMSRGSMCRCPERNILCLQLPARVLCLQIQPAAQQIETIHKGSCGEKGANAHTELCHQRATLP